MWLQFVNAWKTDIVTGNHQQRKSKPNDYDKKTLLEFLSIKRSILNGFYRLLYLASKVLSLKISIGIMRKQQVDSKRNFFTIKNLK